MTPDHNMRGTGLSPLLSYLSSANQIFLLSPYHLLDLPRELLALLLLLTTGTSVALGLRSDHFFHPGTAPL